MIQLLPLQYCDLALKTEKDPGIKLKADGTADADFFCIATAARIQQLVLLLDLFRTQIQFPDQVRALVTEHHRWKSWKIGIESNAYQWALGQAAWDKGLPVIPVPSTKDKVSRAQLTTPHFETGRVRIRGVLENGVLVVHPSLRRFVTEAIDFPFGDHDDAVDSIVGVIQMCMDEEIMGQKLVASTAPGFSVMVSGGQRPGRDPFDVFRSPF